MQDNFKDKLPIFVCRADLRKFLIVFAAALLVAACAAGPEVEPERYPSGDAEGRPATTEDHTSAEDTDTFVTAPLADGDLDADLLFHVLAAERLVRVGDFEAALEHQLEAARLGTDPDLARQVVGMAINLEDWPAVVDGAQRWQELAPADSAPGRFLALGLVNLGEIDQAASVLSGRIAERDGARAAWREVVMLLAATERDQDALAVMEKVIESSGQEQDPALILEQRSLLLWQLGEVEQALSLAARAAERGEDAQRWVWAAQLATAADEMELALGHYQRARTIDPDDGSLALSMSEVLRQLDRLEEAIDLLKELPEDTDLLYTIGTYQVQAGQNEQALVSWERLAALDPVEDVAQHAFLTGFLAELLEKPEQALSWYALVESGRYADRARLRRAIIEGDRGNLERARDLLNAVALSGNEELMEQAWLIEADLLRVAGRADEAVDLLTAALRQRPDSVALLYTRGICAVAIDDLELAEQDFRRILQIDDDNAMALNALGYTLTDRTDRHEEAYRLIRRALNLEPDSPAILDSMGWVYFRLGQPEKALPYLEQALAGEDNPEIAAHVGEVLWSLGRRDEATEVLIDARERFPDDVYLHDTLERLGLLE